jgi:hypothetical protein
MHNQHAGLSQLLAEQHISQWREQAAYTQLARGARRRRRSQVVGGWWQLARWQRVAADHPVGRPQASS